MFLLYLVHSQLLAGCFCLAKNASNFLSVRADCGCAGECFDLTKPKLLSYPHRFDHIRNLPQFAHSDSSKSRIYALDVRNDEKHTSAATVHAVDQHLAVLLLTLQLV